MKILDINGQRFDRWLVLYRASNVSGRAYWNCICDCGSEKIVSSNNLKSGSSRSCGCLQKERTSKIKSIHNESDGQGTPEYVAWLGMRQRCLNHKSSDFPRWGGRGVGIENRWSSFSNFLNDMGRKPIGTSLERIRNNQNYGPTNCRWATPKEQARNRRSSRIISAFGISCTLAEWCEAAKMHHETASSRIRRGWSAEDAFTTHPSLGNPRRKWIACPL